MTGHGRWQTGALVFLGAMFLPNLCRAGPQAATTRGFVVTRFVTAMYEGKTGRTASWKKSDGLPECPEGFALPPDTDAVLAGLQVPPAERARLKRPENAPELADTLLLRGPQDTDVCESPQSVPDPGLRTVKGEIAYGFDLDGSDGTTTPIYNCPHENFSDPNGKRGIDNQLYRVLGCIRGRRQGGLKYESTSAAMRQGDFTILIELTGVDDVRNDAEVQIGFYSGQDAMMNSVEGTSLTYTSLRIHHDRHFHATTRGKIVNGVLSTEPVDLVLKAPQRSPTFNIRDARFSGRIQRDGSLKGMLGGYQEIATIYRNLSHDKSDSEIVYGPMTCPGVYFALRRLADAYPDPLGGNQCTWLSAAYEVDALPAFVIHPKPLSSRETHGQQ